MDKSKASRTGYTKIKINYIITNVILLLLHKPTYTSIDILRIMKQFVSFYSPLFPKELQFISVCFSFLTFSQLATERPEIRQQQLSTSAKDIFFQGGLDVRLGDVKPFLHDLIKKMNS